MDMDQRKQVAECRHILKLGHSPDWLRNLGYAEAAIRIAQGIEPEILHKNGAQADRCQKKS